MSEHNLPTVTKARSKLARLHTGNPNPDPAELNDARQSLAAAKLDREIRMTLAGVVMDDVYVGHLVGLLLMEAHVDYERVNLIERLAREAVVAAQREQA